MRVYPVIATLLLTLSTSGAVFGQAATSAHQNATAKVELNSANAAELDALPGVGPATARKIIAGRPYSSLSDLKRAGVSQATIDKISPLVTIGVAQSRDTLPKERAGGREAGGPPTLANGGKVDLNTANEKELDALPGVGPATAKKIIAGRPYSSVSDLERAGVPNATVQKIAPLVTVSRSKGSASRPMPDTPRSVTTEPQTEDRRPSLQDKARAASSAAQTQPSTAAPSPGMVWVNTETEVFHREGDRWYGKTKNGRYMTEEEAIRNGYRESKTGSQKNSNETLHRAGKKDLYRVE